MGNRKRRNSSPESSRPRPVAQVASSPLLALPFALCSLRSIMNAVRAQPLTRLAVISDRDPAGHLPIIVCEPRLPRLDLLAYLFESRRSQQGSTGQFSFTLLAC